MTVRQRLARWCVRRAFLAAVASIAASANYQHKRAEALMRRSTWWTKVARIVGRWS